MLGMHDVCWSTSVYAEETAGAWRQYGCQGWIYLCLHAHAALVAELVPQAQARQPRAFELMRLRCTLNASLQSME